LADPHHLALSIRSLRFRYPGGDAGVRNADGQGTSSWIVDVPHLDLLGGEQAVLIGKSGSGKSTLLNLIAGLIDATSGTIEVAGSAIGTMAPSRRDAHRGRSIGMIFQTFQLLDGFSALENVMAPMMFSTIPPAEHHARATDLLKELGISRAGAMPSELSVGQQQRVAVARALACGPELVLADEPTASLDPENALIAMRLIIDSCTRHKAALLCSSHDPSVAAIFTRRVDLTPSTASVVAGV